MVEYYIEGKEFDCLTSLTVMVDKSGQLTPEELESIDEQMLKVGSSRTGQRIDVSSTEMDKKARVQYVYQESLLSRSVEGAKERLDAFSEFDGASISIGTEIVEIRT